MEITPQKVSIKEEMKSEFSSRIVISPLPRGFGTTLGNSLRRVLLSSLKGYAFTQVKFEGVSHEFTTIKGVKEDVLDITLNLKKVRLRLYTDNPTIVKLSVNGPKEVRAADLDLGGQGEVLNKDLHLATLADSASKLEAELVAESGVGYVLAGERPANKVSVISLDSIFSPVSLASFVVEGTRVGRMTNLDKLTLDITTNGTLSPMGAFIEASKILSDFFERLGSGEIQAESAEDEVKEKKVEEEVYLEELGLPTRTVNALKKTGIKTLQQLLQKNEEDLAKIRNLGSKSVEEIKKVLSSHKS